MHFISQHAHYCFKHNETRHLGSKNQWSLFLSPVIWVLPLEQDEERRVMITKNIKIEMYCIDNWRPKSSH